MISSRSRCSMRSLPQLLEVRNSSRSDVILDLRHGLIAVANLARETAGDGLGRTSLAEAAVPMPRRLLDI